MAVCEIDLWDMYHDYIEGKRKIVEINATFVVGSRKTKSVRKIESFSKRYRQKGMKFGKIRVIGDTCHGKKLLFGKNVGKSRVAGV